MEQFRKELESFRIQMTQVNEYIIQNLNRFFELSNSIGEMKNKLELPYFDPVRESQMLNEIQLKNKGPMPQDLMKRIFKEIFQGICRRNGSRGTPKAKSKQTSRR